MPGPSTSLTAIRSRKSLPAIRSRKSLPAIMPRICLPCSYYAKQCKSQRFASSVKFCYIHHWWHVTRWWSVFGDFTVGNEFAMSMPVNRNNLQSLFQNCSVTINNLTVNQKSIQMKIKCFRKMLSYIYISWILLQ